MLCIVHWGLLVAPARTAAGDQAFCLDSTPGAPSPGGFPKGDKGTNRNGPPKGEISNSCSVQVQTFRPTGIRLPYAKQEGEVSTGHDRIMSIKCTFGVSG